MCWCSAHSSVSDLGRVNGPSFCRWGCSLRGIPSFRHPACLLSPAQRHSGCEEWLQSRSITQEEQQPGKRDRNSRRGWCVYWANYRSQLLYSLFSCAGECNSINAFKEKLSKIQLFFLKAGWKFPDKAHINFFASSCCTNQFVSSTLHSALTRLDRLKKNIVFRFL